MLSECISCQSLCVRCSDGSLVTGEVSEKDTKRLEIESEMMIGCVCVVLCSREFCVVFRRSSVQYYNIWDYGVLLYHVLYV